MKNETVILCGAGISQAERALVASAVRMADVGDRTILVDRAPKRDDLLELRGHFGELEVPLINKKNEITKSNPYYRFYEKLKRKKNARNRS